MSAKFITTTAIAIVLSCSTVNAEEEHVSAIKEYIGIEIAEWLTNPVIIAAINKQNETLGELGEDQIIALDKKWRAETGAAEQPMINEVLSRKVSKLLINKQDATAGMISEAFVMDNKGLNVGQTGITSDFWQGR